MLYYEGELLVAINIPYISTTFAIEKPPWVKCNVKLTQNGLEIKSLDGSFIIPFKSIELINRSLLPQS